MAEKRPTWSEYRWPDWVPLEVRQQIERFWSDKNGRGPEEWEKNATARTTTARRWAPKSTGLRSAVKRTVVSGRYVHRWNNIGCVVKADGTHYLVSGIPTPAEIERAELVQATEEYEALGHG
jgi:hypothetical protein